MAGIKSKLVEEEKEKVQLHKDLESTKKEYEMSLKASNTAKQKEQEIKERE